MRAYLMWSGFLSVLIGNSVYTCWLSQRLARRRPQTLPFEIAYLRRQQCWSWLCVVGCSLVELATLRSGRSVFEHYSFISLIMAVTVIAIIYGTTKQLLRTRATSITEE